MSSQTRRRRQAKQARRDARRGKRVTEPAAEIPLINQVAKSLSGGDPVELLSMASMVVSACDERNGDPFQRARGSDPDAPELGDLIDSFIDVPTRETSALLAVLAEIAPISEFQRAGIRREVAERADPLPVWIQQLAGAAVREATLMTHVLGDGDDILLGVELSDGRQFTVFSFVDHNMGSILKDAFVLPLSLPGAIEHAKRHADGQEFEFIDLPLADARQWLTEAIEVGAMTYPSPETDTWPGIRPLLEWLISRLPEGGVGYRRPNWDEAAQQALSDQFFASPHGTPIDDHDNRDLLQSLLWYGTDYGCGDPTLWSAPRIEILLLDWLPRKVIADPEFLLRAPALLRAFVPFASELSDVPPDLTAESVAAIDHAEPEFRGIVSGTTAGPDSFAMELAQLARRLTFGRSEMLQAAVGGPAALDKLDDRPLPDEPFVWIGIEESLRGPVGELLRLIDECCDALYNNEIRTASRRLLARAAVEAPRVVGGKGKRETLAVAVAVVWIIVKANELGYELQSPVLMKDLAAHFGLAAVPTQRARTLLAKLGLEENSQEIYLGSPEYLTSSTRRWVVEQRDLNQAEFGQ